MQHNRRGGGEWPACYGRSGIDLPRPILIFVAATKNSFACSVRWGNEVPRPTLISVVATDAAGGPFFFDATKIRIGRECSLLQQTLQAEPCSDSQIWA